MAIVEAWESLLPADGDALSDGDNKIRDFKRAVRERMVNGGIKWEPNGGATTDQDAGKLTCGVQGTTGILTLIENEAEAVVCTVRDGTDAGGNKQFEVGDSIGGSEQYDLRAHTMTARDFTMSGSGTADLSAGTTLLAADTTHKLTHDTSTSSATLTASYQTIHTSTAFTTKSGSAGDILISWTGVLNFNNTAANQKGACDIRIQRDDAGGGFNTILTLSPAMAVQVTSSQLTVYSVSIPILFVDTNAIAATSTIYRIQAVEGSGNHANTTVSLQTTARSLIIIELLN